MDSHTRTCRMLEEQIEATPLHRPVKLRRYSEGVILDYDVLGVERADPGTLRLQVERFVGGGFAGQVYRVKVLSVEAENGSIGGIRVGGIYALKILIPPSGFSRFFRDFLYRIGFQGPFQLQVNPEASRAGALWQKFFRRGAEIRFGDATLVNDIHATLVDRRLGGCGEISDWVDGRTWKLEVDDRLDFLKRYLRGKHVGEDKLGSPEYRSKKRFMTGFVRLLHDMGGREFARQYEWWTAKSQPNCLKRLDSDPDPEAGLVAVDFRAGLVLLPFMPMSPGDVKLIFAGLSKGSLVQFDRGDVKALRKFIDYHPDDFSDMSEMLAALECCEENYRKSVPDIFHNHFRLLYSRKLWSTILAAARRGWRIKKTIDEEGESKLARSTAKTVLFYISGILPFLGGGFRRLWGHRGWRKHYRAWWTSRRYRKKSWRTSRLQRTIAWVRKNRISVAKAETIAASPGRYFCHLPLSLLPAGLHRFSSDWHYAKDRFYHLFIRPVRLYFNAKLREEWLREMLKEGQSKQILSSEDSRVIEAQLPEPFIQKYLKSLAVHLCTLPVTQIVSLIVSWVYVRMNPQLSTAEAMAAVAAILVLFQITPISPGSLVRGFYVLYLVIKERNFRDYNIAVFLGFFKYIGYLAFPIQMAYRYPALARFMAGHWATEATHVIPVFGERGALLEHWVFNLFYNWPLTVRRRIRARNAARSLLKPRHWHVGLTAAAAAVVMGTGHVLFLNLSGSLPYLKDLWWLFLFVSFCAGVVVTHFGGGCKPGKRILASAFCGVLIGVMATLAWWVVGNSHGLAVGDVFTEGMWQMFLAAIFTTMGGILWELRLPDPNLIK